MIVRFHEKLQRGRVQMHADRVDKAPIYDADMRASTGPRADARGSVPTLRRENPPRELQRGRVQMHADRIGPGASRRFAASLQRGRVQMHADRRQA